MNASTFGRHQSSWFIMTISSGIHGSCRAVTTYVPTKCHMGCHGTVNALATFPANLAVAVPTRQYRTTWHVMLLPSNNWLGNFEHPR